MQTNSSLMVKQNEISWKYIASGIGGIIIGAVLALLIVFLLQKRKTHLRSRILIKVSITILPKQRNILNQKTRKVITIISTMLLTRTQMIKTCMIMLSIYLQHTQNSKWTKKMEITRRRVQ